jgi:hypothetical protein
MVLKGTNLERQFHHEGKEIQEQARVNKCIKDNDKK